MRFTDYYGEQSCTAGRSSSPARACSGPGSARSDPRRRPGAAAEDPTIAELLKPLGYATGQFGKNHLGDKDEWLPSNHGFDEFVGNLYHLNAEEEPELPDHPPAWQGEFPVENLGLDGHAGTAPVGRFRPTATACAPDSPRGGERHRSVDPTTRSGCRAR